MASAESLPPEAGLPSRRRWFRWEKILRWPRSLFAQTAVILALSAAMITGITVQAFREFTITPIAERSADQEAALLVLSAQTWLELPADARPWFELELAERHDLIINLQPRKLPQLTSPGSYLGMLQAALNRRLGESPTLRAADGLVWVDVPIDQHLVQIGIDPSRTDTDRLDVALLVLIAGVGIVLITALILVQRITGPLAQTARAARRFRGSGMPAGLPEEGPKEIVSLAHSFNTMAREIAELMTNRTTLLAGISHDLRTPIARMRLAVELLPPEVGDRLRERLEANLESMESLIQQALQYARGLGLESTRVIEVAGTLGPLVEELGRGRAVWQWQGPAPSWAKVAVQALRRVLQNLIDNGGQYSEGAVEVRAHGQGDDLVIHVLDRGEGIPLPERSQVFQPFYRLESSRSRRTGGSGLGLAIVSQLCGAQGWLIEIVSRPGGGSDFVLTLRSALVASPTQSANGLGP